VPHRGGALALSALLRSAVRPDRYMLYLDALGQRFRSFVRPVYHDKLLKGSEGNLYHLSRYSLQIAHKPHHQRHSVVFIIIIKY